MCYPLWLPIPAVNATVNNSKYDLADTGFSGWMPC